MMNLMGKVTEKRKKPYDVLSLVFSNFRLASEKQERPNLGRLFATLSSVFGIQAKNSLKDSILKEERGTIRESLQELVDEELNEGYPKGFEVSEKLRQRGVLRAYTWGKKVATIQSSLLKRYAKLGEDLIKEDEKIHICSACGFIMIKAAVPDICPVCKAPSGRFESL